MVYLTKQYTTRTEIDKRLFQLKEGEIINIAELCIELTTKYPEITAKLVKERVFLNLQAFPKKLKLIEQDNDVLLVKRLNNEPRDELQIKPEFKKD